MPEQASDMIQIWGKEHVHAVCTCVCYKIMVVGLKIELSWLDFLVNWICSANRLISYLFFLLRVVNSQDFTMNPTVMVI